MQDSIKFLFFGGAYSLGQLLPMRFKPADLLQDSNVPLLLLPQDNRVEFTSDAKEQLETWRAQGRMDLVEAANEALKECMNAYSPYSKCPSGAAIVTHEGGIYSGGYIESAAYNPSMVPLQTAIVDAVIDGMPSYSTLKAALLVELKHGAVQHSKSMGVNVSQIAPDAEFKVLHVKWSS
jgi:cytidine deaminase